MHQGFRQAHLAGQFKGEGRARQAHFQLEKGRYRLGVELHGAVHHARLCRRSVELEVGIVGGNDAVGAAGVQLVEDGLGDSAAGSGLRTRAKLVNEDERASIGHLQHGLHVGEEGAVGGEVVLQRLVVSNRHHDAVENGQLRGLGRRDEHAPLEHVLQQTHRLEAHALAAGVGAGDEEDALFGGEGDREGHYGFFLLSERLFKKGMAGLAEAQGAVQGDHRHAGNVVQGHLGLGHIEVQFSHEGGAVHELRHKRAQELCKLVEDAVNLPRLVKVELGNLVLERDNLRGFHEGGFSRSALVVHETLELAFLGRCYRNEHLAVPDAHAGIGLHKPVLLGLPEDGIHAAGHVDFLLLDALANAVKLVGGGVLDFPVAVQDGVYSLHDLCGGIHAGRQVLQVGVDALLHGVEEVQGFSEGVQEGAQLPKGQKVNGRILADGFQERNSVNITGRGEVVLEHEDEAHFVGEKVPAVNLGSVGREVFAGYAGCRIVGGASAFNGCPNLVKSQFRLQSLVHTILLPRRSS